MENRVEKANRKLNTMLVANGKASERATRTKRNLTYLFLLSLSPPLPPPPQPKLRDTIEHLRQERHVFNNIHSKLEKQLGAQKREMALIIERSNQVSPSFLVALLLFFNSFFSPFVFPFAGVRAAGRDPGANRHAEGACGEGDGTI
jgi:hypothetical protein